MWERKWGPVSERGQWEPAPNSFPSPASTTLVLIPLRFDITERQFQNVHCEDHLGPSHPLPHPQAVNQVLCLQMEPRLLCTGKSGKHQFRSDSL